MTMLPTKIPRGTPADTGSAIPGGVGDSPVRPDGILKVTGEFAYGSDLWMEGRIWGVTVRSPRPHARTDALATGPGQRTPAG